MYTTLPKKKKVRNDKGESKSQEEGCPFDHFGSQMGLECISLSIANFSSSSGPHSFQQAYVDVNCIDVWKNVLNWDQYQRYFKWIEICLFSANDSVMRLVQVHSYSIDSCNRK